MDGNWNQPKQENTRNEETERYRTFFENSRDGIVIVDKSSKILDANRAYCSMLGYNLEELRKLEHFYTLSPEPWRKWEAEEIWERRLLQHGYSGPYQKEYIKKDGTVFPVELQAYAEVDRAGNLQYLWAVVRDISEQKRAEEALRESEERFRTFLYNLPIAAYRVTPGAEGEIIMANPAFLRLFDLESKDELKDLKMMDFYHNPADRGKASDLVIAKGGYYASELKLQSKTGKIIYCLDTAQLVYAKDGSPLYFDCVLEDITERKQAQKALQKRLRFEKLVSSISSHFNNLPSDQLDEGINYTLEATGKFFNIERSYLFQFSNDNTLMNNTHEWCAAGIEPQRDNFQYYPLQLLPWWANQIFTQPHVIIPNIDLLPVEAAAEKELFQKQGIRSLLCVPIVRKNHFFGVIGFDSLRHKKAWREDEVVLLKVIAELLGGAFSRRQADEKIHYMSFHDRLTGLYNRHFMEEEMSRLDSARQMPLSLVMADLNGLKLINDTYGHTKGDRMLKAAAAILQNSCRQEDLIGRWGGDEFMIIFPRTTAAMAKSVCNRITALCRETYIEDVPISLALGIATRDQANKSLSMLIQEAENLMYRQKLTESRSAKNAVLQALLRTLSEKSFETEKHTRGMQKVAKKIGEALKLSEAELSHLDLLITLHDIGKINIAEELLTKSGPLTTGEWETMKNHTAIGFRIALATEDFAHVAHDILSHHERWDGKGYPQGLKGKEISLPARITAIADAYEVMSNGRPYKKALGRSEMIAEFKRCSGTQFDPELVDVIMSILENEAIPGLDPA